MRKSRREHGCESVARGSRPGSAQRGAGPVQAACAGLRAPQPPAPPAREAGDQAGVSFKDSRNEGFLLLPCDGI